jgi:murein DD-endopeptidase MepM/ murein hydrolase activator NlpD
MTEEGTASAACLSTLRVSISDMIALYVRTRMPAGNARTEYLYQSLPVSAMTLMATIPRGEFAVSIPYQNVPGGDYPIQKSLPQDADRIVIVYAHQPNRRYEAARVHFQGKIYGIAEFHEVARRWVEIHASRLEAIPGQYAYLVPTRELWGVILRDNGYTAFNPSVLASEITPELFASRANSADVVVRIPIQRGQKQLPGIASPVFVQVELMLDRHPNARSHWISFVEHQKARAQRAQPPARIVPDFREWVDRLTAESGFEDWVFRPGMLFGDRIEWWGEGNRRRTEHEGIDFAEGLLPGAGIRSIPEGTPARAIADGEIIAFLDDFLGKTALVRHSEIVDKNGDIFHTFYSHIQPATGRLGPIAKGELLGKAGKSSSFGAPAHLHLGGAWIPQSIPPAEIQLNHIDPTFMPVVLTNFNSRLPSRDNSNDGNRDKYGLDAIICLNSPAVL